MLQHVSIWVLDIKPHAAHPRKDDRRGCQVIIAEHACHCCNVICMKSAYACIIIQVTSLKEGAGN
jgi:hypothetical protein